LAIALGTCLYLIAANSRAVAAAGDDRRIVALIGAVDQATAAVVDEAGGTGTQGASDAAFAGLAEATAQNETATPVESGQLRALLGDPARALSQARATGALADLTAALATAPGQLAAGISNRALSIRAAAHSWDGSSSTDSSLAALVAAADSLHSSARARLAAAIAGVVANAAGLVFLGGWSTRRGGDWAERIWSVVHTRGPNAGRHGAAARPAVYRRLEAPIPVSYQPASPPPIRPGPMPPQPAGQPEAAAAGAVFASPAPQPAYPTPMEGPMPPQPAAQPEPASTAEPAAPALVGAPVGRLAPGPNDQAAPNQAAGRTASDSYPTTQEVPALGLSADGALSVAEVLKEALSQLARPHQVRWAIGTMQAVPEAMAPRLAHVVAELVDAAAAKAPALAVAVSARSTSSQLVIAICDRAPGAAPGQLALGPKPGAVLSLVRRLGGSLTASPEPFGRGTITTLSLPASANRPPIG
jgi:hypothetical protein